VPREFLSPCVELDMSSEPECPPPRALLRVQLVERAVHAHRGVQVVQASVLTDLVHHGGHAGSAHLRRAAGHRAAHLLHDDAVVAGAVEPQLLQDGPDLQQRQTIAVEGGSEVSRGGVTGYLAAAARGDSGLKQGMNSRGHTVCSPSTPDSCVFVHVFGNSFHTHTHTHVSISLTSSCQYLSCSREKQKIDGGEKLRLLCKVSHSIIYLYINI